MFRAEAEDVLLGKSSTYKGPSPWIRIGYSLQKHPKEEGILNNSMSLGRSRKNNPDGAP